MTRSKIGALWLKVLGGKPEHGGIAVMAIALFVTVLGAVLAFSATERNALYWSAYAIVAVGIISGWSGIIYHRILLQRYAGSDRNDA